VVKDASARIGTRPSNEIANSSSASLTLEGAGAMHMLEKEQVMALDGKDAVGRMKFVESLFSVSA
jgi:hypothetical protein